MRRTLTLSWLTLLLYTGGAFCQHQVQVPRGPLLRTEASAVSIWCNASGSSEGGFEWSLFPSHSPSKKLQILSSADPHFSYAVYRERVSVRREIYLERVGKNAARLHITHLRAEDGGEYECHTPNTAHTYYGSYSASVRLTVIPDLLRVLNLSPAPRSLREGDPLTLLCEVSSETPQHTHVSVAWLQASAEAAHAVLGLSAHAVVSAGPRFAGRHRNGELRIEKLSAARYQLALSRLRAGDAGGYFCRATEWIQDPDGSWYPLITRSGSLTTIQLSSPGVMSAVKSASENSAAPPTLLVGLLALLSWPLY
ncbi:immunoglobulin superfamily member 3-like [Spea bombifrons]|uniref:immunoglobulin superfamily member 3-like n=1 Tax=Spea bombifrons TaxID=233779 RepID=UPI00234B87D0|nr:immunoglobulin superfamily member 3-like [Spea bombifrons]